MGRSAISKAMPKKSREQHVSGLASSKSSKRKNNEAVKFGTLSRKQKNDLKEYGSLVPHDFEDEDEDNEESAK